MSSVHVPVSGPATPVPMHDMTPYVKILSFDVGIRHLAFCVLRVPKATTSNRGSSGAPGCIRARIAQTMKNAVIDRWDMIDLERVSSVDACCKRLTEELHARFAFEPFDIILIERQPKHRSIMMVAIQMFLCSYFNVVKVSTAPGGGNGGMAIRFMHASKKLMCCPDDANPSAPPPPTSDSLDHGRNNRSTNRRSAAYKKEAAARYKENKRRAVEMCDYYLRHVLEDYANAALLEQYSKKDDLCDAFLQAVAHVEESLGAKR
jgi:Mitochondrial resolvase Ydc2 / RNA splicing MRS1